MNTSIPGAVKVQIMDGENEVVCVSGESKMNIQIPNARLWSVDHPNPYTARMPFPSFPPHALKAIRKTPTSLFHFRSRHLL